MSHCEYVCSHEMLQFDVPSARLHKRDRHHYHLCHVAAALLAEACRYASPFITIITITSTPSATPPHHLNALISTATPIQQKRLPQQCQPRPASSECGSPLTSSSHCSDATKCRQRGMLARQATVAGSLKWPLGGATPFPW